MSRTPNPLIDRTEELMRSGVPQKEAVAQAREELGMKPEMVHIVVSVPKSSVDESTLIPFVSSNTAFFAPEAFVKSIPSAGVVYLDNVDRFSGEKVEDERVDI